MTKFMQVSFIVVLLLALAFTVLQLAMAAGNMSMLPASLPHMGWNTWTPGVVPSDPQPNVGWNGKQSAYTLPALRPNVGWNT
jgi:hypothetical protein